jgi:hypothetical protein
LNPEEIAMHAQTATLPHSVLADLDALVLEEVKALRADPSPRSEAPPCGSDEEFMARASAYLKDHDDPERVIERLRSELGLSSVQHAPHLGVKEEPASTSPENPTSADAGG